MLENLLFSLNSTMPLFFVMVLGYVLRRRGFINDNFVAQANKFVFNIALPALLFKDLAGTDIRAAFDGRYVLFCAGATLASILVIWGLARVLLRDKTIVGEFVQACYRSSAAILGSAFIQNIYGADHSGGMSGLMILGSVPLYNVFAVLILVLECPDKAAAQLSLGDKLRTSLKKIATNPIILGIVFGLLAGLLPFKLPAMATKTLASIGGLASPLALLAIGAGFQGSAALAKLKPTAAATFIKLLVLPAVFLPLAVRLGFTDEKLVAILVMLGSITTPSAYVMAKQMGHEGTLTASVCVCTTVFSALSLTFWLFLAHSLGYIA